MLDDAADVVQREIRQSCVTVTGKQVFAVFPNRLVNVHTRAVIANDGFGHKGRGLAIRMGYVLNHIFQNLGPVGTLNQGAKACTDFVLASASDFVVEHFNGNAQGFKNQRHFCTHVLGAVNRRNGEVAALDGRTVAFIATRHFFTGVPWRFCFVNFEERARHIGVPTHVVKNEEFRLRTEIGGIANARGFEVGFSALSDRTGIAVIGLAVAWLDHIAAQKERGFFKEWVDIGGIGIGHELHVRGFNAFPSCDGRAVKGVAGDKFVFVKMRNRHGNVLLFTTGVGEAEINKLDFVFFHHLHHVCDGLGHQILLLHGY